jgi:hypothetical protein
MRLLLTRDQIKAIRTVGRGNGDITTIALNELDALCEQAEMICDELEPESRVLIFSCSVCGPISEKQFDQHRADQRYHEEAYALHCKVDEKALKDSERQMICHHGGVNKPIVWRKTLVGREVFSTPDGNSFRRGSMDNLEIKNHVNSIVIQRADIGDVLTALLREFGLVL